MDSHCLIQKRNGGSVFGMEKAFGKLYVINSGTTNSINNVVGDSGMTVIDWHNILGHISITSMQHIPVLKSVCTEEAKKIIEMRDICHKAKQCRNPFPISSTQSTGLFEVVHVDVWGPYKVNV